MKQVLIVDFGAEDRGELLHGHLTKNAGIECSRVTLGREPWRTPDAIWRAVRIAPPSVDIAIVLLPVSAESETSVFSHACLVAGFLAAVVGPDRVAVVTPSGLGTTLGLPPEAQLVTFESRSGISYLAPMLREWVLERPLSSGDASAEVVGSASSSQTREQEYEFVHRAATTSLHISGIGMVNARQTLPSIAAMMLEGDSTLEVTFLVLDPQYCLNNRDLVEHLYRPRIGSDASDFIDDVEDLVRSRPELADRLSLLRYPGIMTFVCTTADLGAPGSVMLAETLVPRDDRHLVGRPRVLLRRKSTDGLYDRFSIALSHYIARSIDHGLPT